MAGESNNVYRRLTTSLFEHAFALTMVSIALAITTSQRELFGTELYLLFWGAVAFSASYGGLGPGLLATIISVIAVEYLRTGTLPPTRIPNNLFQHLLFIILAMLMSAERDLHRRTKRHVQQTNQKLEMLMETAQDFAIISTDPTGCITSWSAGAQQIFGYAPGEVLAHHISVLFPLEDRKRGDPEKEMQTAARTGVAEDNRWCMRKNGERFFSSGFVRPIYGDDDEIAGFLKITRDATAKQLDDQERAALLAREQSMRERLEQLNQIILRFVAVISHEIRTPLTAAMGFVSTLLEPDIRWPPEKQREFLTIVNEELSRLTELTEQLMDYTRLESGSGSIARSPPSMLSLTQSGRSLRA